MDKVAKAAVLGAGSWGTALATVLVHHADEVALWGRDPEAARAVNERRENPRYLPGVRLDPRVRATTDGAEALDGAEAVVCALPTKALAAALAPLAARIPPRLPVISAAKGICTETLRFPSRILQESLGRPDDEHIFALSGPSFALETARGLPTAVTFAGKTVEAARGCGRLFFAPAFRTYPSGDMIGVEVAGALKNVIALAAGAADGLGLGANARSALMTRGLAEITRFGRHFGADPLTFLGLSGVGDLVLTCTGALSRNRRLGGLLAQGRGLEDAQREIGQTAEGVFTARAVHALAAKEGLDMPISRQVHAVLFEGKPPQQAILDLITRPMRTET